MALNQVGSVLKSSKENGQLDYGTTGKTNIRETISFKSLSTAMLENADKMS